MSHPFIRIFRTIVAAGLVVVLAACAGMREMREHEQSLALYIKQIEQQARNFQAQRDGLARAREQDIKSIADDTRQVSLANVQTLDAWRLADDRRVFVFSDLRSAVEESVARRAASIESERAARKAVDEARGRIDIKVNRLGDSAKALAELAEKKSRLEQLRFYDAYVRDVLARTRKLEEDAANAAKAAAAASACAADESKPVCK